MITRTPMLAPFPELEESAEMHLAGSEMAAAGISKRIPRVRRRAGSFAVRAASSAFAEDGLSAHRTGSTPAPVSWQ